MTLAATAAEGERLATLNALRNMLAADLDICESMRDKAALSLRLMDVLEQISEIEKAQPQAKGTPLDEFTKRRAAKGTPSGSSRTKSAGE